MVESFKKNQKYTKLRKHHRDLGVPWTDPIFPPSDASIGIAKAKKLPSNVQWKRPKDLCPNPKLFVDGPSSKDVTQGLLGNCWVVAACAVLAGSRPLLEKVIPDSEDQEFTKDDEGTYSGVFRFRFWRFGKWIEVLVDDLLPTHDGELIFMHSASNSEFWGPLLEKAYAKLHGSYAALDGGNLSDALVDFTSGVSEVIKLDDESIYEDDKKKKLWKTMASEMEDHALMCCAKQPKSPDEMFKRTSYGLINGHAYGITAMKKVPVGDTTLATFFKGREKLYLIRLQNPWGEKEWTGAFSDKSPEWSNITAKEREKLGITFDDDGEFWMTFDDFLYQFTEMSICRVINTSLFSFNKTWKENQFFGSWSIPERAGGCLNNPATILKNPQYRFDIHKDDDEVIIQLSQKDVRSQELELKENLVIGFLIVRVEENRKYRLHRLDGVENPEVSSYIKTKHIFHQTSLKRGRYLIIPTTYNPEETTDFLLRVFTDNDSSGSVRELKKDIPVKPWWNCSNEPVLLTRIKVKGARGLKNQDTFGGAPDPYCIIKCESKVVEGFRVDNEISPDWNVSGVFYRKKPEKPLKVQVWNHNIMVDSFLGQVLIESSKPEKRTQNLDLKGRRSKKTESMPGQLTLEIETYDDLQKL